MVVIEEGRECRRCLKIKTEFRSKNVCMDCRRVDQRKTSKASYQRHSVKIIARTAAYNDTHPEVVNKSKSAFDERHPGRIRQLQRWSRLNREYGLTEAGYDDLVKEQGGQCAICKTTEPGGIKGFWSIDHDHETGKVRALLCARCNPALGLFNDDPAILEAAANYLRYHHARRKAA